VGEEISSEKGLGGGRERSTWGVNRNREESKHGSQVQEGLGEEFRSRTLRTSVGTARQNRGMAGKKSKMPSPRKTDSTRKKAEGKPMGERRRRKKGPRGGQSASKKGFEDILTEKGGGKKRTAEHWRIMVGGGGVVGRWTKQRRTRFNRGPEEK